MNQSTKMFVVIGFMFLLFITLNGHLEKYLKILFSSAPSNSGSHGIFGLNINLGDPLKIAQTAAMFGPL